MASGSEKLIFHGSAAIFILPALYGVNTALGTPPPVWTLPPESAMAAAQTAKPKRTYLELDHILIFGVGNKGRRAVVRVAFAAELAPEKLPAIAEALSQKKDAAIAQMTEDLLAYAEKMGEEPSLPQMSKDLPPILKNAVNRTLANEDVPAPVTEVLILELAVQ